MLIKRNTYFSAIDQETGEERLFSVSELLSEDEYLERFYSHDKETKKEKKIALRDIDSNRGLGRSLLVGQLGGAIGGYAGKRKAEELDDEGKSDKEIIEGASKHGGKVGAITKGVLSAASGSRAGVGAALTAGAVGALFGGAGGYLGARKNAQDKIEQRERMKKYQ